MQAPSLLCSSHRFPVPFQNRCLVSVNCLRTRQLSLVPLHSAGRRWLRQQVSGREAIQEVELLDGRGHPGQKSWIVKFSEIHNVDQAQLLIGSSILVTEEDKPELEEGEFYSHDLVGMKVILKETGKPVGTVVNVFNSGANDLLHVMLNLSTEGNPNSGPAATHPLVWVPFVEAIVPNIDINKREMFITPPKGLLELNIRTDDRSKKERRQLEWKERKKFQQRLIAAKKRLSGMEQQHVFHGFRFGGKAETRLLSEQIISVNSKLLQQVQQNIEKPAKRWNLQEFIEVDLAKHVRNTFRVSEECLSNSQWKEKPNASSKFQEKGHLLTAEGKLAIILFMGDDCQRNESAFATDLVDKADGSSIRLVEALFHDNHRFLNIEDRASVPLILVCPANDIQSLQNTFASHNHFTFDSKKVWFLEEEKLPVVTNSPEEQNKHKILMKSPWEILQRPVGSGGVISLLSSDNILDNLSNMGVDYIEVCAASRRSVAGHALLGLVSSCQANAGIRISEDTNHLDDDFDMVFSIQFMKHLTKQINELQFHAIPERHPHVEKVGKEWVDVVPSSRNSYELRCSIYSSLNLCPPHQVCLMNVTK
ncbi:uncharacterized protein LOC127808346 isoform X2 [Diospyros lotus]|uniref:uncharacterized protein LOC127808346 isoform X2 n=1 Tax=Diospyros lotus TaxID=55363 RepID=UPI0022588182|nr:uncharacterized protein LOC127808346 isoform X2 [Diospyros lotus]